MKKKLLVLLTAVTLLWMSSSCNNSEAETNKVELSNSKISPIFIGGMNVLFDVDKENNVYILSSEGVGGENTNSEKETVLTIYNINDEKTFSGKFGVDNFYDLSCMCAKDNFVYYISRGLENDSHTPTLYSFDFTNGITTYISDFDHYEEIEKIYLSDGSLYIIGTPEETNIDGEVIAESNGYEYPITPKKISVYNIDNDSLTDIDIFCPLSFSVSTDGELIIYSYDQEKEGYCFVGYNDGRISELAGSNMGNIIDFDIYDESNHFVVTGIPEKAGCLTVSAIESNSGLSEISEKVYSYFANDVKCTKEFIYFLTGETQFSEKRYIAKISTNDINYQNTIKIISSEYIPQIPYGCGYSIEFTQLDPEEFALKTLSLDEDYDICIASSGSGYAANMFKSNVFLPLNNVEGVSEYLAECFPYVSDVAIKENGEVWMLPIELNIPILICNAEACESNGIVFSRDLNNFIDVVSKANALDMSYGCNRYIFIQNIVAQYIDKNRTFDTHPFRNSITIIKEKCTDDLFYDNYTIYPALMELYVSEQLGYDKQSKQSILNDFLFYLSGDIKEQTEYILQSNTLRAVGLPNIEGDSNNAKCYFLCINPYSKNVNESSNYISALSNYLKSKENTFIVDNGLYSNSTYCQSLYEQYKNSSIMLGVPNEIYVESLNEYLERKIDLDDFINEVNRKLKVYIYE